jgi:hypothetical protein
MAHAVGHRAGTGGRGVDSPTGGELNETGYPTHIDAPFDLSIWIRTAC